MQTLHDFITEAAGESNLVKIPKKMLDDIRKAIDTYKENGYSAPVIKANNDNIRKIVWGSISILGKNADLNFIDVSGVTDMKNLFGKIVYHNHENNDYYRKINVPDKYSDFNGDISKWDTSNVTDMNGMFSNCAFNGDISGWDVSKVTDMSNMFSFSYFDGDLSKWDVSNVNNMASMFCSSQFTGRNGDITGWFKKRPGVRYAIRNMDYMFIYSQYNGDISDWDVSGAKDHMESMFAYSKFDTSKIAGWAEQPTE